MIIKTRQAICLALVFSIFVPASATGLSLSKSESGLLPVRLDKVNIRIDGLLDEEEWTGRQPLRLDYQLCPNEGRPPAEDSEVWLYYDLDAIYLAVRLHEKDPGRIMCRSLERDSFTPEQDAFGLVLDAQNDHRTAYAFIVTPYGVRTDMAIFSDAESPETPWNLHWNAFWDAAVRRNETGWTVEMRIPFSSLRFETKGDAARMGVILWRYLARNSEYDTIPAIPNKWRFSAYKPSQALDLDFTGILGSHPLYLRPYILSGLQQQNTLDSRSLSYRLKNSWTRDLGLDLKYNLTSGLILDATVNTDFVQVEADDQQINLTRFSLFLPEKRAFFQERSDLFSFKLPGGSQTIFHSRSIGIINEAEEVPILGGVRLTGQTGGWEVGLLNMQTAAVDIQGVRLPSENLGVFRLKHGLFGNDSFVGAMATTRLDFLGHYNTVIAADLDLRVKYPHYLGIQLAQSLEPGREPGRCLMSTIMFSSRIRKGFSYGISGTHIGTDFNPGLGFMYRTGINRFGNRIGYTWFPSLASPVQSHGFSNRNEIVWDIARKTFETFSHAFGWEVLFRSGATANVQVKYERESLGEGFSVGKLNIGPGRYRFLWGEIKIETPSGSPIRLKADFQQGGYYGGSQRTIVLSPSWTMSAYLTLSLDYNLSRVNVAQKIYDAHIARFRMKAAINRALSLGAYIQYNSDLDLVTTNIRIRYNPKEGTDLYLVYNEGTNTVLDREIPRLPRTQSRTILIKYSYTFAR